MAGYSAAVPAAQVGVELYVVVLLLIVGGLEPDRDQLTCGRMLYARDVIPNLLGRDPPHDLYGVRQVLEQGEWL